MKKGSISSSESKKCVLCGKKKANFRYYEQADLEVRIPLCDTKENKCMYEVDSINFEKNLSAALRSLKKELKSHI